MSNGRAACTRRMLLSLAILVAGWLSGCSEPRGVLPDQIDLVTWYVEDVTHGNPRDPHELVLPDSSDELAQIATWLAGSTTGDQHVPPRQLTTRRDRWPLLKALFLQGHVVVLDDGLVAANPQSPTEDQAFAIPIVDAENRDRRTIDTLLIGMAKADRSEAKTWLARIATARIALDTHGGAKRWVGKY